VDTSGNLYVVDSDNSKIRKATPAGVVTTVAGGGVQPDGKALNATFNHPLGIVADTAGSLYVAEKAAIRKITPDGMVSTLAGSGGGKTGFLDGSGIGAAFNAPQGSAIDAAGNLYVADSDNRAIRRVSPAGEVTTIAGTGEEGFADGPADKATFTWPKGVVMDAKGVLYAVDRDRIRKLTPVY